MKIDKHEYQKGKNGVKYGIYNSVTKKFQFNICEDTPMLAKARLFQLIGDDARKWRFDVKRIDIQKERCHRYVEQEEIIGWNGPHAEITRTLGRCMGTRELDACSCEGNTCKCDFYESVRKGGQ